MKKKIRIITILLLTLINLYASKNIHSKIIYNTQTQSNYDNIWKKDLNASIKQEINNRKEFLIQIKKIKKFSPSLYKSNMRLYQSINNWLKLNSKIKQLKSFEIQLYKLKNLNNYGNIKITSYYTPIINARKTPNETFKYPIYSIPHLSKKYKRLPNRRDIYHGILKKKHILAYSNSLIDNFIMDVQGSGIINYGLNKPLMLFKYTGENNWPYTSIGNILIRNGSIKKENMSIKSIRDWSKKHVQSEVKHVLEQNNSFVFFKPMKYKSICGASAVPLIPKTSIASDRRVIKPGDIILAEIPILNEFGKFTYTYETKLLISLDVGGAIKGQKIDIYQGIGEKAGIIAGFYNHYGRVWILKHK
ncbi:murein transglycosylase A [Buchnera aphidicola]|uniref:Membrane-bound lytic murein transglycosylase A n=1 Tax=Buchnera aphidicola subsp. Melaphis rhois TaxID=118103 RepID=A0A4D6YAM9_BUCMH|nr:murein transglycosylase A [Buchnera aphidicola]QCI23421.1 murein transglycosylase A [Buchnera aphidicola (Melaphis rhois)]